MKKRSIKVVIVLASVSPDGLSPESQKFFGSFFQKRTCLLLVLLPLLLHLPSLTGVTSETPAPILSGMATSEAGLAQAPRMLGLQGYPGWIDGNAGVTLEALGGLAARDWLHGRLPWWNPYNGVGLPLATEAQNAAFFLPFVLLLALPAGIVWLKIAMQIVAGLSMLGLLRRLDLSPRAALTGAILAECNGSFAWLAHAPILPIAFLPLLLLGIERAGGETWSAGVVTISLAVGFSLAAGFPEVAFLDGMLASVWAVVRLCQDWQGQNKRWFLLFRLVLGAGLGVLLAAPAVEPFLAALPGDFVGPHTGLVAHVLPGATRALLLFPYLLGPLLHGTLQFRIQPEIWFSAGGFAGVLLALLALTGVFAGGRERALRWALGLWIGVTGAVVCLDRGAAVMQHLPVLSAINLPPWIVPSWLMSCCILAAFALDAWERGIPVRRARILAIFLTGFACLAVLPAAWPAVSALLAHGGAYPLFPAASLLWAGIVVVTAGWLLARPVTPSHVRSLHRLIVIDAVMLFLVPLAAHEPPLFMDRETLGFLHDRMGLGRVYTAGPMQPNYGAYFGIAQINHNYLPLPSLWVGAVRSALMPGMDGVNFYQGLGDDAARAALRTKIPALEAFGVSTVLTWPGDSVFGARVVSPIDPASERAVPLARAAAFQGTMRTGASHAGGVLQLEVRIGTYLGQSDGSLHATLCSGANCASGQAPLAKAVDNDYLPIALDHPLAVEPGDTLTYTLVHLDGDHPVALWADLPALPDPPRLAAELAIDIRPPGPAAALAHHGAAADVWELPDPAPYWSAPGCRLTGVSRTSVDADCDHPSMLRRLELDDPGWSASVNGTRAAIRRDPPVFEAVDLPSGHSHVRFAYAPPDIGWAWAGFTLGLAGFAVAARQTAAPVLRRAALEARVGLRRRLNALPLLARVAADRIRADPYPAAFAAWLLPVLIMIALLTPPFQNSDEPTHVARIVQVAHGGLAAFRFMGIGGGISDPAVYQAFKPVDPVAMHPEARITAAELQASRAVRWGRAEDLIGFPNTALYPPTFYVPSAAAYWIGRAAKLHVDHTILLMRIVNALVFTGVAWVALATARRLRPLMAAMLMLPMTLSLACAASQDSLMIAAVAVAVGIIDRVTSEQRDARADELAWAAILLTAAGMARPPYLCLLTLLLLLRKRPDGAVLRAMAAGAGCILAWSGFMGMHTMVSLAGSNPARQLHLILADPLLVPRVAWATLINLTGGYWHQFIGTLGWTDTPLPGAAIIAYSLVLALAAVASGVGPARRTFVTVVSVGATIIAIFAIQYFTWSSPGQDVVAGVLGRYFLVPVLAAGLALPALGRTVGLCRQAARAVLGLAALATPAVVAHALVLRYYLT